MKIVLIIEFYKNKPNTVEYFNKIIYFNSTLVSIAKSHIELTKYLNDHK